MGRSSSFVLRAVQILLLATFLALSVALPASAHEIHIVKPGETLSQIAQQYDTTVAELRRLNHLDDEDFIWYGQRLIVAADNAATNLPEQSRVIEDFVYYVVQPGDHLTGLAQRYGVGLAQLVELNHVSPAQRLYIGQVLKVPARSQAVVSRINRSRLPVHVVQPGEYLSAIAARYDTTVAALLTVNDLADPSHILPGQKLRIASASTTAEAIGPDGYHVHTEFPTVTEKWIDVDLSEQRVVAYVGTTPVKAFIVSTGLPGTPTVTGTFRIWAKVPVQDMYGGNRAAGDYYYLPDVRWVQYFYEDYSFHGTYWHNNFGRPMSHGCVNMRNEDARWLFDWASPATSGGGWIFSDDANPGTLVVIHP